MLGTGTPAADPDRCGPATAIVVDHTCASSTAASASCDGGPPRRAPTPPFLHPGRCTGCSSRICTRITTLGYADLILSAWTIDPGPRAPLLVFGPSGTRAMTEHLLAAYAEDIRVRTGAGGELTDPPPPVEVREIGPGIVYRDSLVAVTAFAVHHGTFAHAFGFRFRTPDRDTRSCSCSTTSRPATTSRPPLSARAL